MKKVFLGGTCNGSSWRDELIKDLKIDYFQPCAERLDSRDDGRRNKAKR